jgi:hypothetical protein
LTDTQIDSIGYKTKGNRILCPITDHRGRVGGIKVWDWDAKDESGKVKPGRKKYCWQGQPGENVLNDGQLPIAVYGAELAHGVVALTEGMEIKPALASARLNLPVIGTNGSNFVGSWQRKKEALEAMGASIIRIYPDAGAITNPQLVEQYRQVIQRAQADGYRVEIAWWGQFLKHHGDIDEINDRTLAKIRYLTPDKFEGMVRIGGLFHQYLESTSLTEKGSGDKVEVIDVEYLSERFPDGHGVFRPGKGHGIKSGMGTGKTTVINHGIVAELPGIGLINLGYRNTLQEQFSAGLERFSNGERTARHVSEVNDFWLNPAQCIRLCLDSLLKLPCWEDESQALHYFDRKYILLDEVMADLKHLLFSSTLKDKRFEVLKRLNLALQRCAGFVYADTGLADWAVRFLGEISGKPQEITHNTRRKTKAKLTLLEGTIHDEQFKKNDNSPLLLDMVEAAMRGESFAVASDSQHFIEKLELSLVQDFGITTRIIRIDGKTTELKYTKEFVRDTERVLEELYGEPVILLFTTSAESGIDIPNRGIFSAVYGFYFGVIHAEQFCQMLGRVRDQEAERKVWIGSHAIASDDDETNFDAEALEYWQSKFLSLQANLLLGEMPSLVSMAQEIERELTRERKIAYDLKALRNFEKRNLRDCTIQRLLDCGYSLTKVTLDRTSAMDEVKERLKEAGEDVKRQNCQDVATACNDYIGKPYKPTSTDATWAERCAQEKSQWFDRLPGFWGDEDDPVTYYTMDTDRLYTLKYGQRGLVRGLELYHLSQNLDQAKTIAQNRYLRMLEQGFAPWDDRTQYLKARALSHLPLAELIEALLEGPVTTESAIAQSIMAKVTHRFKSDGRRLTIFSVLGKRPGKSIARYLSHLCRIIGIPVYVKRGPDRKPEQDSLHLSSKQWKEIQPILEELKTAIATRYSRLCTGEDFSTRAQKLGPLVRGQTKMLEPSPTIDLSVTKNEEEAIKADSVFCRGTNQENTENRTVGAATDAAPGPDQWQPYRDGMVASLGQWVNHVLYGVCRVEQWGRFGIDLTLNGVPLPPCDSGQITHVWQALLA